MKRMKFFWRRFTLQRLQLKSLRNSKDSERYSEQKRVLFLLFKPTVMFSTENKNYDQNRLYKYTNALNAYCKSDELYKLAKKELVA
ncbi:hypothetical protein P7E02_21825 [Enterococcus hulanensis]|uniref:hypothetical protein n=1 Tax=Enterococcus hulanensis TaxID=2559929 RepID=UPI0010FA3BCF|nr:hypothetical protein [Enterococcus hulanensis]MDT2662538.1 hypothetical protein [Enterococcus hulanensis]